MIIKVDNTKSRFELAKISLHMKNQDTKYILATHTFGDGSEMHQSFEFRPQRDRGEAYGSDVLGRILMKRLRSITGYYVLPANAHKLKVKG